MYSNRNGEQFAATFIGTQWLWDKQIYADRSAAFDEEIASFVRDEYDALIEGMSAEGIAMSTARTNAVEDKWEIYHFFANDDIGAPREIFTYVNDEGNVVPFSDADMAKIESWQRGEGVPVEGIEGHHLHPVSYYPDNVELAADPNNIAFATEAAHFEHLHGGNYANYTEEHYLNHDKLYTHEEMLEMTLDHRHDLYMSQSPLYEDVGLWTYIGVGALGAVTVFTVVKAAFEWHQLRGSGYAPHVRRKLVWKQALSHASVGSMIAVTAVGAKAGYDTIFHDVSMEVFGVDVLFSALDVVVAFGAAQAAAGAIRYIIERKKINNEQLARQNLQSYLQQTAVEMAAFTGIGLGAMGVSEVLQSLGEDALASVFDPTGITAVSMLTYKGFKFGRSIWKGKQNKQAYEQCNRIRVEHLLEQARGENHLEAGMA